MKSKIIKSILFSTTGILSVSAVTPIVLSSCGRKIIPVTGVTIDANTITLSKDSSSYNAHKLKATVIPGNATNKKVIWSTNNDSVVIVDQNGNVAGKGTGTAVVYAITEDGNKTAACKVVVVNGIPVQSVSLSKGEIDLSKEDIDQLTATVIPGNATNKKVTFSSSDISVATVDQNGKVRAVHDGTATITATTEIGGYKAICNVIVSQAQTIGYDYGYWGDIKVKYKLLSNSEARLLTKSIDGENGYVEGEGVLTIPDHVVYKYKEYYVREIPYDWSEGSNNIDGIEFASDVSHLRQICDGAFKSTDALNNYNNRVLIFPEGLEYIGTEAFYDVDMIGDLVMYGIDFPSTLNAINVRAFAHAGTLGNANNPATLMFRGNFNTANMANEAFSSILRKHLVQYVYAPAMEIAANIANHIRVVYEDYFVIGDNYLIPKVIGE